MKCLKLQDLVVLWKARGLTVELRIRDEEEEMKVVAVPTMAQEVEAGLVRSAMSQELREFLASAIRKELGGGRLLSAISQETEDVLAPAIVQRLGEVLLPAIRNQVFVEKQKGTAESGRRSSWSAISCFSQALFGIALTTLIFMIFEAWRSCAAEVHRPRFL